MSALRRILCVEDEPDIQAIVRLALETVGGYEVRGCASGCEALALITEFEPDLVLLDVMMPDMDGPSTLAALRRLPAAAGIPVAFITAKVQPREVAALRALGALDVIAKPFDPMTLADTVRQIWARHHA